MKAFKKRAYAVYSRAFASGGGILLALALVASMGAREETPGNPRSSYGLGSAAYLEGDNLLYSLFVDTPESSFEEEDKEEVLKKLLCAADYIETEAEEYGCDVKLICDFDEQPLLTGSARVDFAVADEEDFLEALDEEIAVWTEEQIDYEKLKKAYRAEGLALLVFINNPGTSYAIVYDGTDLQKESLVLFAEEPPSVYAHEILHLFGAHDLYSGAEYTKEIAEYVAKNYPTEIMYTVLSPNQTAQQEKIENSISPITAYHLGWIDEIEEIELFPQLKRE